MKTLTAAQLDRAVQALRPSLPTIATALNATETALYRWRTGSRTVPSRRICWPRSGKSTKRSENGSSGRRNRSDPGSSSIASAA